MRCLYRSNPGVCLKGRISNNLICSAFRENTLGCCFELDNWFLLLLRDTLGMNGLVFQNKSAQAAAEAVVMSICRGR